MSSRKGPGVGRPELSLVDRLGILMGEVHGTLLAEDWGGLRPSHLRFVSAVPEGGSTISELAPLAGMTKQACGQYVAFLVDSGHLRLLPDPADGRIKRVRRTTKGTRAARRFAERLGRFEDEWAARIGSVPATALREALEALTAKPE